MVLGGIFAGYDGVGADDGSVSDAGPGEDGHSIADPDVRADDDLAGAHEGPINGALGGRTLIETCVAAVGVIGDDDAAAAENTFAEGNAVDAGDVDLIGQVAVRADGEERRVVLAGEGGDGIEPKSVARGEVMADSHMGEAGEPRMFAEAEAAGAETPGEEPVAGSAEDGPGSPMEGEEEAVLPMEGGQGGGHRSAFLPRGGAPPTIRAQVLSFHHLRPPYPL